MDLMNELDVNAGSMSTPVYSRHEMTDGGDHHHSGTTGFPSPSSTASAGHGSHLHEAHPALISRSSELAFALQDNKEVVSVLSFSLPLLRWDLPSFSPIDRTRCAFTGGQRTLAVLPTSATMRRGVNEVVVIADVRPSKLVDLFARAELCLVCGRRAAVHERCWASPWGSCDERIDTV